MKKDYIENLPFKRGSKPNNWLPKSMVYYLVPLALHEACEINKIAPKDFLSKKRNNEIVTARQLFIFTLRYKYQVGPLVIAKALKKLYNFDVHHSTVIYAAYTFFDLMETNKSYYEMYQRMVESCDVYLKVKSELADKINQLQIQNKEIDKEIHRLIKGLRKESESELIANFLMD